MHELSLDDECRVIPDSSEELLDAAEKDLTESEIGVELQLYETGVTYMPSPWVVQPDKIIRLYEEAKRGIDEVIDRFDDDPDVRRRAVRAKERLENMELRIARGVGPFVFRGQPVLGYFPDKLHRGSVESHIRHHTPLLRRMIPLLHRIFKIRYQGKSTAQDREFVRELAAWRNHPHYWAYARFALKDWGVWESTESTKGLGDQSPEDSGATLEEQDAANKNRRRPDAQIDNDRAALGGHVASRMSEMQGNSEIQYPEEGEPEFANETYWMGASIDGSMVWQLREGVSASAGIRAWIKGPTRADCESVVCAAETDALRAALGDEQFDKLFGRPGGKAAVEQLQVGAGLAFGTVRRYIITENVGEGTIGKRPVEVGSWHYFCNHPMYPYRHPSGLWAGLHAVYMGTDADGKQRWTGHGVNMLTEQEIYEQMLEAYNTEQSAADKEELSRTFPPYYVPEHLDSVDQILNHPVVETGDTRRKGGFDPGDDKLSMTAIAELKNK